MLDRIDGNLSYTYKNKHLCPLFNVLFQRFSTRCPRIKSLQDQDPKPKVFLFNKFKVTATVNY